MKRLSNKEYFNLTNWLICRDPETLRGLTVHEVAEKAADDLSLKITVSHIKRVQADHNYHWQTPNSQVTQHDLTILQFKVKVLNDRVGDLVNQVEQLLKPAEGAKDES